MAEDTLEVVSAEDSRGRILSGVGVDAESLQETMERHAPIEKAEPETAPASAPVAETAAQTAQRARDEATGQFAKEPRGKKRIDQLTGEREAEKRAREAAERERDEYRRQLDEARAARSAPATPDPAPHAPRVERPAPQGPQEPDFEKDYESKVGTQYATYGQAVQAYNRDFYQFQQIQQQHQIDARIRQSIEADRASRSLQDHVSQSMERGRKVFSDFDAVRQAPHMMADNWPMEKIGIIASLPEPERVQYVLGRDPALAEQLRVMTDPVQFGMALAQVMASTAVASPASTARTMTPPPPPPMQPVAGGSKTTVPSSADLASRGDEEYDRSGYREKRKREREVFNRR